MNEKFFDLPEEKRQRIINAGYRVFARNSYKKSPMSEIAAEAEISKSLLFYYFHNKKELYLFLWEEGARITMEYLSRYRCYEPTDLFEMMERGMRAKLEIMRVYPNMSAFTIKAFYEKDQDIYAEIQDSYRRHFNMKAVNVLSGLDPEKFVPGLDIKMMYQEMLWASEGYLWEIMQRGQEVIPEALEKDFTRIIDFWKSVYLKKGE